MSSEPVVVHEHDREWQSWPQEQVAERGNVRWKTLISAGLTASDSLTLGVARLSPGETLRAHRHEQAEAYLVLDGAGIVTIDGSAHVVGAGAGIFIAGNVVHSVESTGQTELRVAYVLAADAFEDVEYVFGETRHHPLEQSARRARRRHVLKFLALHRPRSRRRGLHERRQRHCAWRWLPSKRKRRVRGRRGGRRR